MTRLPIRQSDIHLIRRPGSGARNVNQRACPGNIEHRRTGHAAWTAPRPFDDGDGGTRDFQPLHVEWNGKQASAGGVQDVTCRHVTGIAAALDQQFPLA